MLNATVTLTTTQETHIATPQPRVQLHNHDIVQHHNHNTQQMMLKFQLTTDTFSSYKMALTWFSNNILNVHVQS